MISLDVIGFYLTTYIFLYVVLIFYQLLVPVKFKINSSSLLILLIMSAILLYNNFYSPPAIRAILSYILSALTIGIVLKQEVKLVLVKYFAIWLLIVFYETIIVIPFSNLRIINANLDGYVLNVLKMVMTIFVILAMYFTLKLSFFRKKLTKITNFVYRNYGDYFTVGAMILMLGLLGGYKGIRINDISANIIVIIVGVLIFLLLMYFLRLRDKQINSEIKNRFLENSNEVYDKIVIECEIFNHNKNNQLLALRSVANAKTKKLIDEMLGKQKNCKVSFLPIFKNAPIGIKDILFIKFSVLSEKDLKIIFATECEEDVTKKLSLKNYNAFLEAVGIVLDNTVEALQDCKEKSVFINIEEEKGELLFKIINTFDSELDLEKLGERYYTTKKKGSGIGIYSIKVNKRVEYRIEILNDKFQVTISTHLKN